MLRRAALDSFSTAAWRRRTGSRAGAPGRRRAGRQRGAGDQAARDDRLRARPGRPPARSRRSSWCWPRTASPSDEGTRAAVLGPGVPVACARSPPTCRSATCCTRPPLATSGDLVLKMDDDDWYAPDAIADLVRAHAYSGAEVVGMPAEFHYLTEPDVTVTPWHTSRGLRALRGRRDADDRARPAPRGRRLPVGAQVRGRAAARRGDRGRRHHLPRPRPRLRAAPQRHRPHLAGRPRLPARPRPRRRDARWDGFAPQSNACMATTPADAGYEFSGRPRPRTVQPAARQASKSRQLRPSSSCLRRDDLRRARLESTSRNSGHSVRCSSRSASRAAVDGVGRRR